MARLAGANKVMFTSAAPPIRFPHVYGINMPSRKELIAHNRSIAEIASELAVDHIIYQEIDDLRNSITYDSSLVDLDLSCFDGHYVTGTITDDYLDWLGKTQIS